MFKTEQLISHPHLSSPTIFISIHGIILNPKDQFSNSYLWFFLSPNVPCPMHTTAHGHVPQVSTFLHPHNHHLSLGHHHPSTIFHLDYCNGNWSTPFYSCPFLIHFLHIKNTVLKHYLKHVTYLKPLNSFLFHLKLLDIAYNMLTISPMSSQTINFQFG